MQNSNFRYDINGLRAYAVILVVLFHFGILGFSAGFIGVDIFFVISGFLMTSIVIKSLEKGNFSLLNFYLARGIRIVPALFVVSIIVLILGWFFLLPPDYRSLGKHTFSSINFFSNIVYWKESGYFDTDSHNKALLHTWSLSVEWQFYLVFPIVVSLLYKLKSSRKFLLSFIILGTIFSFILSIIITEKNPSAGFFLLPTRAWEMLLGGLIFFVPKEKIPYKKPIEFIGFSLIAISCYIFSTNTLWPSYNAILPALGAFLILLAHQQNSIFTKGSIFQWLGNNSYSIYLWHWPIVFFLHYFYKNDDYVFIILGIVLSIILGWISYTYIENPSRKKLSKLSKIKSYSLWFLSITILSLISFLFFKFNGIQNRFSDEINRISSVKYDINPRKGECHSSPYDDKLLNCNYGQGPLALIVIGDSHADALLNGLIHALPKNQSLTTYTISGCSTVLGLRRIDESNFKCGDKVAELIKKVDTYPKHIPIIIINRLHPIFTSEYNGKPKYFVTQPHISMNRTFISEMENAYLDTMKKLSKDRKVYITKPIPEATFDIPSTAGKVKLYSLSNKNLSIPMTEYLDLNREAIQAQNKASLQANVSLVDLSHFFCEKEICNFTKNGIPLFFDDDHMSWTASLKLSPIFKKEIFDK